MNLGPRIKDLTGRRFGRLVVVRCHGWDGEKNGTAWDCTCDCGTSKIVLGRELGRKSRAGQRSCGCLQPDMASKTHRTHGLTKTAEYRAWRDMRSRCGDPNDAEYKRYGARGIRVCDAWDRSFEDFYAHVGPRPAKGLSLDRKDVNGHYEPGNVRWTTARRQQRNRRDTQRITFRGVEMTQADFAEAFGLTRHQVRGRVRSGWTEDEIAGLTPRRT